MPLPPYFKLIIPGAVVSGEGGSFLVFGLLYSFLFRMGSMGGMGSNILSAMVTAFIVIGIISLCIGVPLLIAGLVQRSNYGGYSPSRSHYRGHVY